MGWEPKSQAELLRAMAALDTTGDPLLAWAKDKILADMKANRCHCGGPLELRQVDEPIPVEERTGLGSETRAVCRSCGDFGPPMSLTEQLYFNKRASEAK